MEKLLKKYEDKIKNLMLIFMVMCLVVIIAAVPLSYLFN